MPLSKSSNSMPVSRLALATISALLASVAVGVIFWIQAGAGAISVQIETLEKSQLKAVTEVAPEPMMSEQPTLPQSMIPLKVWMAKFERLAAQSALSKNERRERSLGLLAALRKEILSSQAAAAAILEFLNSGADIPIALDFSLSDGGTLDEAPSFRTALLDLLAQVDPFAAVDYAQSIFQSSKVADEWALAMRNLGWQNHDKSHSTELRARLTQMLDNQAWLSQPSGGFLEAFDIAVHLGGVEELYNMASVLKLEGQNGAAIENGTTHAAFLALDRLVSASPSALLPALAQDADLLAWAPEHRAALMARTDVNQPAQRQALERYLGQLAERPQELQTFTSIYPNRNVMLGRTLVSAPLSTPGFHGLLSQDEASLAAVRDWLKDNRYPAIAANLRAIEGRLTKFVAEARSQVGHP